jgi:hypothetical protein
LSALFKSVEQKKSILKTALFKSVEQNSRFKKCIQYLGKPKIYILEGENLKGIFCRGKAKRACFVRSKDLFTLKLIINIVD